MEENNKGQTPVPLYTKIGWAVAWVVMLAIAGMILRNCATSVIYGRKTPLEKVDSYYQRGVGDGVAGREAVIGDEAVENPVLRKAYSKGYREGVDRGRPATGKD